MQSLAFLLSGFWCHFWSSWPCPKSLGIFSSPMAEVINSSATNIFLRLRPCSFIKTVQISFSLRNLLWRSHTEWKGSCSVLPGLIFVIVQCCTYLCSWPSPPWDRWLLEERDQIIMFAVSEAGRESVTLDAKDHRVDHLRNTLEKHISRMTSTGLWECLALRDTNRTNKNSSIINPPTKYLRVRTEQVYSHFPRGFFKQDLAMGLTVTSLWFYFFLW